MTSLAYDLLEDEKADEKIEVDDDPTPAKCYATKDYTIFKSLRGNREVSEKHVKNLISSMRRENLIKYQPITVNENLEVIDGQHRLEACKFLNVHVHYKVKEGAGYKTAGILNHVTEEWKFFNYLENFTKNQHQDYIKLGQFQSKYGITLKRLRYLMSDKQKELFDNDFKSGDFKLIDNLEEISMKVDKINDIVEFLNTIILIDSKKFLYTDNFWRALYNLLMEKDICIDRFKEKLSVKYQSIRQMSGYKDYVKLLTDIYNWKAKQRIK